MANSKSGSKPLSPFDWRLNKESSIFAKDPAFCPRSSGKTASEAQTENVERRRANGENPGHLNGISKKQNLLEGIPAFRQFGIYSMARPSEPKLNDKVGKKRK